MPPHSFYDDLAPYYHLIYPDWEASIALQSTALHSIIQEHLPGAASVLDLACGIGTQSIGLAKLGYTVTASDISETSCVRARLEASGRGLSVSVKNVDIRSAAAAHQGEWDVVLACDNALPHLLSDSEIVSGLRQMLQCTKPGGLALVSVRDYAQTDLSQERLVPYGIRYENGNRYLLLQSWRPDLPFYDVDFYVLEESVSGGSRTIRARTRYYAVPIARLVELTRAAGFENVACLRDRFFQPVLVGYRPAYAAADA